MHLSTAAESIAFYLLLFQAGGNTDSARCSGTLEDRGVTLKSVYILGSIFIFASEQEYMLPKWALLHIQSHFC